MKKLAVIFPGIRYSPECPLLYFAQQECRRAGYEVLPLYYSYRQDAVIPADMSLERFARTALVEVCRELEGQLKKKDGSVVFISKSIGTVLAGAVEQEFHIAPKQFLMTPVKETLPYMEAMGGRAEAVLGSADPNITVGELEVFCEKWGIPLTLYEGVGHRLEGESFEASAGILGDLLGRLRSFL